MRGLGWEKVQWVGDKTQKPEDVPDTLMLSWGTKTSVLWCTLDILGHHCENAGGLHDSCPRSQVPETTTQKHNPLQSLAHTRWKKKLWGCLVLYHNGKNSLFSPNQWWTHIGLSHSPISLTVPFFPSLSPNTNCTSPPMLFTVPPLSSQLVCLPGSVLDKDGEFRRQNDHIKEQSKMVMGSDSFVG